MNYLPSNLDIIFIGLSRHDDDYTSTSLAMARVLARSHRVFYIENPFTLSDLLRKFNTRNLRKRLRRKPWQYYRIFEPDPDLPFFRVISIGPVLPHNKIPKSWFYDKINLINDLIIANSIKDLIKKQNIKEYVLINSFNPFYLRNIRYYLQPSLYIYQTVDSVEQGYLARHGNRLEKSIFTYADTVIATSRSLANRAAHYAEKVYFLPNGADFELFHQAYNSKLNVPKELKNLKNPIVGYIGNLDALRIDFNLIQQCATTLPHCQFLLIGPFKSSIEKINHLKGFTNVHFMGPRVLGDLPQYVNYFTVGIIPFLINDFTRYIYPLKLNEYLAAGKPVVTTNFSEDINLGSVISIANTPQEFIDAIRSYTEQPESLPLKEKRIEVAKSNSWNARVDRLIQIINEELNSTKSTNITNKM